MSKPNIVIQEGNNRPIKIWTDSVEDSALTQLKNLSRLPFIASNGVACMPDVHAGIGSTVGTVIATDKAIIPAAVGVDIGCLDMDTEFLSRKGWVKISEYEEGQEVLGFDVSIGEAKFANPSAYIEKPAEWFYHLHTVKGLDQMLTPDHKVLFYSGVKSRGYKPLIASADEFVEKHESLTKGLQGGFKTAFLVEPSKDAYKSDNWIRLLVMISADGCLREGSRIEMHFKKPRKITRCKELLEAEGIKYAEYLGIDSTTFITFSHGHLHSKDLDFVYYLSAKQLAVVADESILWDGSSCTVDGTTRKYYSSTVKANADAVQFAFAGSGVRAGIYTQTYPSENWKDCYYVIPTKNDFVGIRPGVVDKVQSVDGKAYCFTMPTGFFVARRNNNIFVTGNCGMNAVRLSLKASDLPDNLKDIRHQIERDIPMGTGGQHKDNAIRTGVGMNIPISVHKVFRGDANKAFNKANNQAGTLGSGNHFIEICLDENQDVWVMLHSGSRGIGNMIGSYFIEKAKKRMEQYFITLPDEALAYFPEDTDDFNAYVEAVNWAQNYALENRRVMMQTVLVALKRHIPVEFTVTQEAINCHHNYVEKENHFGKNLWVTRKGAIRARKDDLGIIPGSMGQKSYIVRGKGVAETYCSCSHGAGRKMSRAVARKNFTTDDLVAQTEGVECRKDSGVLDEIPSSYKDIDVVMEHQKDLVEIVHTLKQVLCCKG